MKKFESKYRLEDHMDIHNKQNQYSCTECDEKFTTKFTYERHLLENHTEVKSFECNQCQSKFSLERNLQRHLKNSHDVIENLECECSICGKTFKRNDNLLQHQRDVHNINKRKLIIKGVNDAKEDFCCSQCGKIFKLKNMLKRHVDTVHSQGINLYICEICRKGFNRNDNLTKHKKVHD